MHDGEPGPGAYVVGGHWIHARAPIKDEVPGGQGAHPVSRVKKPAGHSIAVGPKGKGRAGIGRSGSGTGRGGSGTGN